MSGQKLPTFPAPSLALWGPREMKERSVVFRKFRFLTGDSVYSNEVLIEYVRVSRAKSQCSQKPDKAKSALAPRSGPG